MLLYFFTGGCKISANGEDKERILNICMHNNLVYRNFFFDKSENQITFTCTLYTMFLLETLLKSNGIEWTCIEKFGLPYLVFKYRKRYGVLIGIILSIFVVMLSGCFVWDVRIIGNERLDDQQVIDYLSARGLKTGCRIKTIDVDVIENKVLIESDDISWVSVNLIGTVAYVEIRERLPQYTPPNTSPANVVAACDGQIESIETFAGEAKVKSGQLVRKGDLLISGVYDSYPWGYRYLRADGNVKARTIKQISIEIPLDYQEKVYTGASKTQNSIIFFSNEIKLFRNTRFFGTTYDTIYKIDKCCLPNGIALPLELHSTTFLEYTYEPRQRTPQQAIDLAYEELDKQVNDLVNSGATVLRKNISGELKESTYLLECKLVVIENIAEIKEFEVLE